MTLCYFPGSTEALRALERARLELVSAIVYSGAWPLADAQTPIKLLRAFFGPRWVSRDVIDMDDCMIEEGADFLHRLALEMRMRGPKQYTRIPGRETQAGEHSAAQVVETA